MKLSNKKLIGVFISVLIVSLGIVLADDTPPDNFIVKFYDSFRGFVDLNYPEKIYKQWDDASSVFLYLQTRIPNSYARIGLAYAILSSRSDKRILPRLKRAVENETPDINRTLVQSLIKYGSNEASPILMKIVNKYKNVRFDQSSNDKGKSFYIYINALEGLALLRDEAAYPITLNLAKNGTSMEKNFVFMSVLYNYNNHLEEIAPLYYDALLNQKNIINVQILKELKSAEAIPVIKKYAELNPLFKDRAEETIEYLKKHSINNVDESITSGSD